MTILIGNLLLLVVVLYVLAVQIDKYNHIIFDKYRFRYFELRDKLAMLVIDGKLDENSWEYQKIVSAINFHIKTIETVSINKIISLLIQYHTSPEEERKVRIIQKKTEHPEVIEIMAEFMDVTVSLLKRNSKMQIKMLDVICKTEKKAHKKELRPIASHKLALDKLTSYRDDLRGSLAAI